MGCQSLVLGDTGGDCFWGSGKQALDRVPLRSQVSDTEPCPELVIAAAA